MESLLSFNSELRGRFEKLGLLHKRGDQEFLSAPFVCGSSVESAEGYGELPARVMSGMSRLEELRLMARALKIPEEKIADAAGFAARIVTYTASDESQDRYGDRILVDGTLAGKGYKTSDGKRAKGWMLKNFAKNPVFMFGHEYTPEMSGNPFAGIPLGLSLDTWAELDDPRQLKTTVLYSDGTSNPMAPRIHAAYVTDRTMRAVSVGFLPEAFYVPTSKDERVSLDLGEYGYLFTQQELLENSAVSVPGNANALMDCLDMTNRRGLRELSASLREFVPEFSRQVAEVAAPTKTFVFIEQRGATKYLDMPLAKDRNEAWSSSEAEGRVRKWASSDSSGDKATIDWAKYAQAFFWVDAAAKEQHGGYKLPFADVVDGKLTAIWKGVTSAAAAMQGSRGGVDIPDVDVAPVKTHIAKYYAKAAKQYGDDTISAPWSKGFAADLERGIKAGLQKLGAHKWRALDGDSGQISLEETIAAVRAALRRMLGDPWAPGALYWDAVATFDDSVVVAMGDGEFMRYPITWTTGEDPVLGEGQEVEQVYLPSQDDVSPFGTNLLDVGELAGVLSRLERAIGELNGAAKHESHATSDPGAMLDGGGRAQPPDAEALKGLFNAAFAKALKPKAQEE
jgi:hypothetical protein